LNSHGREAGLAFFIHRPVSAWWICLIPGIATDLRPQPVGSIASAAFLIANFLVTMSIIG